MKALELPKLSKKFKFEGVWGELEAKTCFQRQSFTKYLRLTLAFMRISARREKFNFCFQGFFASSNNLFFSQEDRALGYHSMKFWDFPDIS